MVRDIGTAGGNLAPIEMYRSLSEFWFQQFPCRTARETMTILCREVSQVLISGLLEGIAPCDFFNGDI